jgi:hypothetical protein
MKKSRCQDRRRGCAWSGGLASWYKKGHPAGFLLWTTFLKLSPCCRFPSLDLSKMAPLKSWLVVLLAQGIGRSDMRPEGQLGYYGSKVQC